MPCPFRGVSILGVPFCALLSHYKTLSHKSQHLFVATWNVLYFIVKRLDFVEYFHYNVSNNVRSTHTTAVIGLNKGDRHRHGYF